MKNLLITIILVSAALTPFESDAAVNISVDYKGVSSATSMEGMVIDYYNCGAKQNGHALTGTILSCNRVDEMAVMYKGLSCTTVSTYNKLPNGDTLLSQVRFDCPYAKSNDFGATLIYTIPK